jgi:hypothetical protein
MEDLSLNHLELQVENLLKMRGNAARDSFIRQKLLKLTKERADLLNQKPLLKLNE